jgi:hypothetical protein
MVIGLPVLKPLLVVRQRLEQPLNIRQNSGRARRLESSIVVLLALRDRCYGGRAGSATWLIQREQVHACTVASDGLVETVVGAGVGQGALWSWKIVLFAEH